MKAPLVGPLWGPKLRKSKPLQAVAQHDEVLELGAYDISWTSQFMSQTLLNSKADYLFLPNHHASICSYKLPPFVMSVDVFWQRKLALLVLQPEKQGVSTYCRKMSLEADRSIFKPKQLNILNQREILHKICGSERFLKFSKFW